MLLQSEFKTESLILRLLSLCNLSYSEVTIISASYKLKQNFHANIPVLYSTLPLSQDTLFLYQPLYPSYTAILLQAHLPLSSSFLAQPPSTSGSRHR